jgi:glyoxylase-like metal-dependent hydrolase (beta-lactamase superfamily II)
MTAGSTGTDAYDGRVAVGGPPQRRDAGPLTITKIAVGAMDNNAYFLRCSETGDVVLIDAAAEPDRLIAVLNDLPESRLTAIVTTHQHGDHWQALPELVAATGPPVVAHPADAPALPVAAVQTVTDGDTVAVGRSSLAVIHLVGHTPGSIALLFRGPDRPHLFTGDSLFPGGVGRTSSPEEFASLYADVTAKLFDRLPDETWVYPGHGADTTLGAERPQLPAWGERGW